MDRKLHIKSAISTNASWRRAVLSPDLILAFLVAIVVLFFRMPERLIDGYLWAEDATVFIAQGFKLGARAIVTPYAGYLHIIPRLVVYIYQIIGDVRHIPLAFAWSCALITAAICACLYSIAARYLPRPGAFAAALAPVLIPHVSECWLNVTNLQWIAAPLLLAMLLDTLGREDDEFLGARCGAIFLLSLTGAFSTVFMPLAIIGVVRFWRHANRGRRIAPFVVVILSGCIQLAVFKLLNDRHPHHPLREYIGYFWAHSFFKNFVLDSLFDVQMITAIGSWWKPIAFVTAMVILVCMLSPKGRWRFVNAVLILAAIGLWMLGVVRTDAPAVDVQWFAVGVARYTFMPLIFAVWALAIAAARSPIVSARYVSVLVLAILFANSATRFGSPTTLPEITALPDGGYAIQVAPGGPWHTTLAPR